MKKVCMNYNQFMTKFKSASSGYTKKASDASLDSKTGSGKADSTSTGPVKGAGTAAISRFTKEHLSNVKGKTTVKKAGTKK